MIVSIAKIFSTDFQSYARKSQTLQVLTIDYSHFCEFSLWALKEQKVPFEEHGYAPGQHVLPVLSVRVGNRNKKHLSSSSRIVPVQSPEDESCERLLAKDEVVEKERKAKAGATAVPIAILPNGDVLRDSWEIAEYPGILAPVHPELKTLLDKEIGPLSRHLVYAFLLKDVNRRHWDMLCTYRRHWLWRFLWWSFVGNTITDRLKKAFQPQNLEAVSQCREKLLVAVRTLDEWIEGRCFDLNPIARDPENPLSMADIAVASLLAPVLMPPKYIQGKYNNLFQNFEKTDLTLFEELEFWRNTKSG
eukprot:gene27583-36296_t